MGCDVHMLAEAKCRGEWAAIGRVFEYEYFDPKRPTYLYAYSDGDEWESNKQYTMHPYTGRNYNLFAVLADVRNYEGIVPLAQPRGLPEDVSLYVKKEHDEWGCDGHSASWFTVDELIAYDWDRVDIHSGIVTPAEYREFKDKGRPRSWCGDVFGRNVVIVDNATMDKIVAGDLGAPGKSYYTPIEWPWTIRDATRDFVTKTIPELQKIREKEGVEDVRIVFWFDN